MYRLKLNLKSVNLINKQQFLLKLAETFLHY